MEPVDICKISLSCSDDKCYILNDCINSSKKTSSNFV